tara:strand:- start:385 stop:501 length:117 start_codon:yes stop_codon:yes gene_type:complete
MIPKRIRCKTCKKMFANPMARKSGIVLVNCKKCREAMK